MAIANNRREALQIANDDTNKKKKLERSMIIDLRAFFRDVAEEFTSEYMRTSTIISLSPFLPDMIGILRKAYRKGVRRFNDNIRSDLDIEIPDEINNEITRINTQYVQEHSIEQSDIIVTNTETQLNNSVNRTINEAFIEGELLSNSEVARLSGRDFINRSITRSNTIATTEIQNITETTKSNEGDILAVSALLVGGQFIRDVLDKRWFSRGDEKVRLSHIVADGQTVSMNGVYRVQGQLLKNPGDMSLGATIDNVANCRCVSVYMKK